MIIIENPKVFFDELGNLHDARIENLNWSLLKKRLSVSIDDMNSSFEGLPEYGGHKSGEIFLEGVEDFEIQITSVEDHINIHEFAVNRTPDSFFSVEIKCWPGGNIKAKCSSLFVGEAA